MTTTTPRPPVLPGEIAPDFALPAVDGSGMISLAAYRAKSPVLLALFRGLWCPFCRRAIAQLAAAEGDLKALGVETLGVVATSPENAQLYFRFRPLRMRMGADPELSTHRAYGLPKPELTPELMEVLATTRINPTGELSEPLPLLEAAASLTKLDGYADTQGDRTDFERQGAQLKGQFLIDRDGVVRWANIECADGLAGFGRFPSADEILAAARAAEGIGHA